MPNEIATRTHGGGVAPYIGPMDETDAVGMGNFAQLIQKNSKRKDEDPSLKDGWLVDGEGNKLNGKKFLPIFKFNVFTKFIPVDEGGGVEWRTTNSKEERVVKGLLWKKHPKTKKTVKPEVAKSLNIIAVFDDNFDNPVVLPFRSTSMRAGQGIIKQAVKDKAIFARYYSIESSKETKNGQTYFILGMKISQDKPSKKVFETAKAAYEKCLEDYTRMAAALEGTDVSFDPEELEGQEEQDKTNGKKKVKRPF